jgi:hypothetical protein
MHLSQKGKDETDATTTATGSQPQESPWPHTVAATHSYMCQTDICCGTHQNVLTPFSYLVNVPNSTDSSLSDSKLMHTTLRFSNKPQFVRLHCNPAGFYSHAAAVESYICHGHAPGTMSHTHSGRLGIASKLLTNAWLPRGQSKSPRVQPAIPHLACATAPYEATSKPPKPTACESHPPTPLESTNQQPRV